MQRSRASLITAQPPDRRSLRRRDDHRGARIMPVYTYTTLDDPLATTTLGTEAFGINDSGQIVGAYLATDLHQHGFLYSGGTTTTLVDTQRTVASGINAAGRIVGSYVNDNITHGFVYISGTYTSLDDPLATGG